MMWKHCATSHIPSRLLWRIICVLEHIFNSCYKSVFQQYNCITDHSHSIIRAGGKDVFHNGQVYIMYSQPSLLPQPKPYIRMDVRACLMGKDSTWPLPVSWRKILFLDINLICNCREKSFLEVVMILSVLKHVWRAPKELLAQSSHQIINISQELYSTKGVLLH